MELDVKLTSQDYFMSHTLHMINSTKLGNYAPSKPETFTGRFITLTPMDEGGWSLRWFTPSVEVKLCGHATLASAFTLWETGGVLPNQAVRFSDAKFLAFVVLGLCFVTTGTLWCLVLVWFATCLGGWLEKTSGGSDYFKKIAGAVFVLLGARLFTAKLN
jgi:Phenazine biosynthesis-like protein